MNLQTENQLSALTIWSMPGSFLWIPTLVNSLIGWEIIQLTLSRRDSFDGSTILWQIVIVSIPIALIVAGGWIFIAAGKLRLTGSLAIGENIGCNVLAGTNFIAPALLYVASKSVT